MRIILPLFVLLTTQLSATAAPRKVARKLPVARLKATPLSPEKLRGQIAFVRGENLWVIDPKTRAQTMIRSMAGSFMTEDIDISPDLKLMVNGSEGGTLVISPLGDGKPRILKVKASYPTGTEAKITPYVHPGGVTYPQWSPDGTRIAYTLGTAYLMGGPPKYSTEVRVMNADGTGDHHVAGTTHPSGPEASRPVWSREGTRLLFSYYAGVPDYQTRMPADRNQLLTALVDGSDVRPFDGNWSSFAGINSSRDGKKWLQRDEEEGTGILRVYAPPTALAKAPYVQNSVAFNTGGFSFGPKWTFSPDASQVAFDGTLAPAWIDARGNLAYSGPDSRPAPGFVFGLFLTTKKFPQLIARDARLIKWL